MIPQVVSNLKVATINATGVTLTWQHSLAQRPLVFRISITCVDSSELCERVVKHEEQVIDVSQLNRGEPVVYMLNNLHPFTQYRVSVTTQLNSTRCVSRLSPTIDIHFRTAPSAPSALPSVHRNGFTVVSENDAGGTNKSVIIHWQVCGSIL